MSRHAVPRLDLGKVLLFVCDMEEKYRHTNAYFKEIAQTAKRVIDAAKILNVPIVVSEDPECIGSSVKELGLEGIPRYPKTKFSMVIPEVEPLLEGMESVILVGLEAHVCILHTAYALLQKGLDVHVVADAVTSRSLVDRKFAFTQLERAGAAVTTSECVIIGLVKDTTHPKFKEIQNVVLDVAPDSGLLNM
ncbi:isochorismatase family protein [Oesophagostomum dentatum]|uniref:Isochorismatase domain-containing protein 1 n=1 Tax=Oesophagostomum dentatum TaxID=61180 RepID=A0A0B1TBL8_OESDE|nr:isochorismatase family protein [Oesophagostomum dentatum]